jgi:hypothetical protein
MSQQEMLGIPCGPLKKSGVWSMLRSGLGILVLACVAGLALTGFYGMPRQVDIHGVARMGHVLLGSVFAVVLVLWTILSVQRHCFTCRDRSSPKSRGNATFLTRANRARSGCFWILLLSAVPLILSVTLNMFACFAMDQQAWVVTTHVWNAAIVTASAMLYSLLALVPCISRRKK